MPCGTIAMPTMKRRAGGPTLWVSPEDAQRRGVEDGAPIRIYNQRGECPATARLTSRVSPGTVWMRDGWSGINCLTDGDACLPDAATDLFPFSVGQSKFDASVEIEPFFSAAADEAASA